MMKILEIGDKVLEELIIAAKQVRGNAYVPYSCFQVGAALLDNKGQIHTGCNVENASYGLSVCAERVALFKAVSQGSTFFQALVLFTDSDETVIPCGACLQVLAEFSPEMRVFLVTLKGKIVKTTIKKLLPDSFTFKKLEEKK